MEEANSRGTAVWRYLTLLHQQLLSVCLQRFFTSLQTVVKVSWQEWKAPTTGCCLSLSLSQSLPRLFILLLTFSQRRELGECNTCCWAFIMLFMVLSTVLNIISLQLSPEEKVQWCHFKWQQFEMTPVHNNVNKLLYLSWACFHLLFHQ